MIIFHRGDKPPIWPEVMNPANTMWLYGTWIDQLADDEGILTVTWVLPAGFANNGQRDDVTITDQDECKQYAKSTGILLSTTLTDGRHEISCRITTTDSQTLESSFLLDIG